METAQNNALRLITGGVKTTPILALQQYTGHLRITREIKQAAVSLTKVKALAQTTWVTKSLDQQHLKTQLLPFNGSHQLPKTTTDTNRCRTHMPNNHPY
jgi:hypothetical protein